MRLLLITTSHNAVRETLERLSDVEVCVIDCVTNNIRTISKIRKSVITKLEVYYSEKNAPDILLTYRCPCLIPKRFYSQTSIGAYNIHPSLLPKYSGLNPWEEIFRNGELTSGVTIHHLTEKPDCGNIILQKSFNIEPYDTISSAREKADELAATLIESIIYRFSSIVSDN